MVNPNYMVRLSMTNILSLLMLIEAYERAHADYAFDRPQAPRIDEAVSSARTKLMAALMKDKPGTDTVPA